MDFIHNISNSNISNSNISNSTNSSNDIDTVFGGCSERIIVGAIIFWIIVGCCGIFVACSCIDKIIKPDHSESQQYRSNTNFKFKEEKIIIYLEEKSLSNNDDECSICQNEIENKIATECNHYFCRSCLVKHLQYNSNCPNCRQPITNTLYIIK